jgi:hypothetical protein
MDAVLNLADQSEPPSVLTQTSLDGLLGGTILADDPVTTYLKETETPRYVVRNKNAGITIKDGTEQHIQPDDSFQTVAVATDQRLVVVVGQKRGDEVVTLPLVKVTQASSDNGRRTSTMTITTEDGRRYALKATGDLGPVARYVDETAQAWVRAYRLLDDATAAEASAREALEDDRFEAALEEAESAWAALEEARGRISELGGAVTTTFRTDAKGLERALYGLKRRIYTAKAHHYHDQATAKWDARAYEAAYDKYVGARNAAQNAQAAAGSEPTAETLEAFANRLREEHLELEADPLASAQQLSTAAATMQEAASAADRWEQVISRYQEVLGLDWGREERRFAGDKETIQEATINAVEQLVAARRGAASDCRDAASAFEAEGSAGAARDAYRTAIAHLERAQSICTEITPSRETGLQDSIDTVERELESVADSSGEQPDPGGQRGTDLAATVAGHWQDAGWETRLVEGGFLASQPDPIKLTAFIYLDATGPGADGNGTEQSQGGEGEHSPGSAPDAEATVLENARERGTTEDADMILIGASGERVSRLREAAASTGIRVYDVTAVNDDRTDGVSSMHA